MFFFHFQNSIAFDHLKVTAFAFKYTLKIFLSFKNKKCWSRRLAEAVSLPKRPVTSPLIYALVPWPAHVWLGLHVLQVQYDINKLTVWYKASKLLNLNA